MKKVNVLLSSYNGEKYIEELIRSVLAQEGVDVILTVRDDGSTDKTIDIIRSFNDSRIRLIIGKENLGPAKSFLTLLRDCETADYYAYCDQDDVWLPNKLSVAANMLSDSKQGLFMSTYDVVDGDLNFKYKRDMDFRTLKMETTIMYRVPSGCVMVLNNGLRDVINQKMPESIRMHDFWTLLIALGIKADIATTDESLIKYRIHGDNNVGLKPGFKVKAAKLKTSVTRKKHERYLQAKSLYDCYYDQFDDVTNKMLLEVVNYKKSLSGRFKLAFDRRFREHGHDTYVNFLFVVSVLLGLF